MKPAPGAARAGSAGQGQRPWAHNVLNQAPPLDTDAALACALLAVDPVGLRGVALRAGAGPWRDAWLALLQRLLPAGTPVRRLPLNASDSALLGGLDLAATLSLGRPVAQQGLLAQADGGVLLVAMAERLPAGMVAHLAAALDTQECRLERDGLTDSRPARLALVALDEGLSDEEQLAPALQDRLAFALQAPGREASLSDDRIDWQAADITAARALLPRVQVSEQIVQALCATALMLGVDSLRGSLLALRTARAAAALAGLDEVDDSHATLAARLVLAPRATRLPPAAQAPEESTDDTPPPEADQPPEPPEQQDQQEPPQDSDDKPDESPDKQDDEQALPSAEDLQALMVLAAQAAIPPGLLAALQAGQALRQSAARGGRVGAVQKNQRRGRPIGSLRGEPRAGARLQVLDTLRAAAPWQKIRQNDLAKGARASGTQPGADLAVDGSASSATAPPPRRIQVRREDFHVMRYKQNRPTTTVFAVDASGSSALHRLAEAKGAVELLLADCYVRRDRVAVLAFRGTTAELLLPPTRSLARAKRSLAALPGGGGTPLARGIEASTELARQIARSGDTPVVVLLTDGRANIARDGAPGRGQAGQDALAAARQFAAAGLTALLIDTSPQPQAVAQALAQAMGATYVPLPHAGAQGLSQAVRLVSGPSQR